jgi:hypothetical protein
VALVDSLDVLAGYVEKKLALNSNEPLEAAQVGGVA